MLNVPPYRNRESQIAPVVSVIIDPLNPSSIGMVYADTFGEMIESKELKFFGMSSAQMENDQIKASFENDKEEFDSFVLKYKPDLIVVGANCLEARKVNSMIRDEFKGKLDKIWVCYGDNTVPQLFAKTAKVLISD